MNIKILLGVLQRLKTSIMRFIKRLLVGCGIGRWMTSSRTGLSQLEILYKEEVVDSSTYQNFPICVTERIIRQVSYSYYWKETCKDQEAKTKESVNTSFGTIFDMAQLDDVQKN